MVANASVLFRFSTEGGNPRPACSQFPGERILRKGVPRERRRPHSLPPAREPCRGRQYRGKWVLKEAGRDLHLMAGGHGKRTARLPGSGPQVPLRKAAVDRRSSNTRGKAFGWVGSNVCRTCIECIPSGRLTPATCAPAFSSRTAVPFLVRPLGARPPPGASAIHPSPSLAKQASDGNDLIHQNHWYFSPGLLAFCDWATRRRGVTMRPA